MVRKTYKNYVLLSVTVVLSFSIMLGYLIICDSNIYNKYNEILGASPEIILSQNSASYEEQASIHKLMAQLDKTLDNHYYIESDTVAKTCYGQDCSVRFLPMYVWGLYHIVDLNGYDGIRRLKVSHQWQFTLGSNEAIVSEPMYESLQQETDDMKLKLVFQDRQGKSILREFKIVGSNPYKTNCICIESITRAWTCTS